MAFHPAPSASSCRPSEKSVIIIIIIIIIIINHIYNAPKKSVTGTNLKRAN